MAHLKCQGSVLCTTEQILTYNIILKSYFIRPYTTSGIQHRKHVRVLYFTHMEVCQMDKMFFQILWEEESMVTVRNWNWLT